MSQRTLAKRASVPQSTISKIDTGRLNPSVSTLAKVLQALECDLAISLVPKGRIEDILKNQAEKKARENVEYLEGTMSLEKQTPLFGKTTHEARISRTRNSN